MAVILEDKEGNHVPFTRIILKFPMIREAFTSLHLCFHEYDVDKNGTMDHSELREAMSRLTGVEMPESNAAGWCSQFIRRSKSCEAA